MTQFQLGDLDAAEEELRGRGSAGRVGFPAPGGAVRDADESGPARCGARHADGPGAPLPTQTGAHPGSLPLQPLSLRSRLDAADETQQLSGAFDLGDRRSHWRSRSGRRPEGTGWPRRGALGRRACSPSAIRAWVRSTGSSAATAESMASLSSGLGELLLASSEQLPGPLDVFEGLHEGCPARTGSGHGTTEGGMRYPWHMDESRLIELELRYMQQGELLQQLSDVLYEQQRSLTALRSGGGPPQAQAGGRTGVGGRRAAGAPTALLG